MSDANSGAGNWRWRWSQQASTAGEKGVRALAVDPLRPRLAVGGTRGVALRNLQPPARERSVRVADVRDLRFDPDGALWIAAVTGLWRLDQQGQLENRSPAPGEAVRSTRRVRVSETLRVVATDGGAFLSVDGARWLRLDAAFPMGGVSAVALREREGSASIEVWALVEFALWRALVRRGPLRVEDVAKIPIRTRPSNELPIDLRVDLPGVDLAVVYPNAIAAWVQIPQPGRDSWRAYRPNLPPGASIRGLRAFDGCFWLLTDRGLLYADSLEGPWRRAGAPAGRADISELVHLEGRLFAASLGGMLEADYTVFGIRDADDEAAHGSEPAIDAVQRAALRYLGLGVEKLRRAEKGLARRGWYPAMGLRLAANRDKSRRSDRDQSFLSGATRYLHDRDSDRSLDLEASITFAWDFGDTVYNPELIDLSREGRLVIALRDDVLDEVNQIYFERLMVRSQLAAAESTTAEEGEAPLGRRNLELRFGELTAGLDSWTGGWFSQQIALQIPIREDVRP